MSTPIIPAVQLLRALGSVVRPAGTEKQPTDGISTVSFDDLLAKARSGELRSDVPVTIAPGSGVELTDEQLSKVALAADRAQAQGVAVRLVTRCAAGPVMAGPHHRWPVYPTLSAVQARLELMLELMPGVG